MILRSLSIRTGVAVSFSLLAGLLSLAISKDENPRNPKKPELLQIGGGTKPFDVTRHSVEIDHIVHAGSW